MSWHEFEDSCFEFLKSTYGTSNRVFEKLGESDSTISDIKVTLENHDSFFIESKFAEAQAGQFVLIPDDDLRKFTFSTRNKSLMTSATRSIIDSMNENYEYFSDNTGVKKISLPETLLAQWIKEYYITKKVEFVISGNKEFVILPLEKLEQYFAVTAVYRVKKSGSRSATKSDLTLMAQFIKSMYDCEAVVSEDEILCSLNFESKKYIKIPDETRYLLVKSTSNPHAYTLRRLSNTANSNVIFSLKLKSGQDPLDLVKFHERIGM